MRVAVAGWGLLLLLSGCKKDDFICGHERDDTPGSAAYCSGEEVCVCATQRCARPVPLAECDAGIKYSFGEEECVPSNALPTVLYNNSSSSFCPQERPPDPPCGEQGDAGACGTAATCLCGLRGTVGTLETPPQQCVVRAEGTCDSGYQLARDGTCVVGGPASEFILRGSDDPVCPGQEAFERTCGFPRGRNNVACPSGAACLCGADPSVSLNLDRYTCIFDNEDCTVDGGLALSNVDGTCLTGTNDILQLSLLLDGGTTCPSLDVGSQFPDAGPPPEDLRCGVPRDAGVRECGAQAACLCDVPLDGGVALNVEPYVCVTANPRCFSDGGTGLLTERGECVGGVSREQLVLRFQGQGVCPGFNIDDYRSPDGGPSDAGVADGGSDGGTQLWTEGGGTP